MYYYIYIKLLDIINNFYFYFKKVYNKDLESDIAHEAFGNLGKLFRTLASGSRPISGDVDHRLADQEAKKLFDVINFI
jgi:hypothetical protein